MTFGGVRPSFRIVVVFLLLLAASPVTAPFSSCDLADLFAAGPSDGSALVQFKSGTDKPGCPVDSLVGLVFVSVVLSTTPASYLESSKPQRPRVLRI
jgi:hypothetical protein